MSERALAWARTRERDAAIPTARALEDAAPEPEAAPVIGQAALVAVLFGWYAEAEAFAVAARHHEPVQGTLIRSRVLEAWLEPWVPAWSEEDRRRLVEAFRDHDRVLAAAVGEDSPLRLSSLLDVFHHGADRDALRTAVAIARTAPSGTPSRAAVLYFDHLYDDASTGQAFDGVAAELESVRPVGGHELLVLTVQAESQFKLAVRFGKSDAFDTALDLLQRARELVTRDHPGRMPGDDRVTRAVLEQSRMQSMIVGQMFGPEGPEARELEEKLWNLVDAWFRPDRLEHVAKLGRQTARAVRGGDFDRALALTQAAHDIAFRAGAAGLARDLSRARVQLAELRDRTT